MNDPFDEASTLLEEAVQRLLPRRYTFTEKEALGRVWEAGYEVPIQSDARFVLAQEATGKHPRHWRLDSHTLANNRLLNYLLAGSWDGRDLEGKLAGLDAEDGCHYVYCPADPRLEQNRQGVLEPAERERNISLPGTMRAELDALKPRLLEDWRAAGSEPWTVRAIGDALKLLGWSEAERPNAWLYVRSWLLSRADFMRAGQDYWIPAGQMPQESKRTRLQVMPVRAENQSATESGSPTEVAARAPTGPSSSSEETEGRVALSGEATAPQASWAVKLRTIHLLEGFLPIPASARGVYPPPAPGENKASVLRGVWFEDNTRCWLWLDREHGRLYGPALAEKLSWLDAGDILRIEWQPDVVVLRVAGHDAEVQGEESRLVDVEELAALRGGLGESYRCSLQAILLDSPEGLTFAEVVTALRERQRHEIHRGTIRAVLYSGGFLQKNRRWFASVDSAASARQLRVALVETLVTQVENSQEQAGSSTARTRIRVKAIHARLSSIIELLRENQDFHI